jgi:hypothetical protein
MVRPRVFVSSTFYDLKHIRNYIQGFLEDMGFDPVLFERGDIPYSPDMFVDESCYEEITNCHILILIIGGRYGSPTTDDNKKSDTELEFYNSVTKREFEKALSLKIPVFVLIDKNVDTEYRTYKKNKLNESIKYAHVDHINIFKLIDEIQKKQTKIFIQPFENFDDISNYLREQFAGLFADFLLKRNKEREFKELEEEITELREITESLKKYTESIMKKVEVDDYVQIINTEEKRINKRTALRFFNEPFISFILKDHTNQKLRDPVFVFTEFQKAKNLYDFLIRLNLKDEYDKFKAGNSTEEAEYDFLYLKGYYMDKGVLDGGHA